MARLFITNKEQMLIADLGKEFIKDIVGQYIHYYPISVLKTKINTYEEAPEKIFENPIKIDALVSQPEWTTTSTIFGSEQSSKFEVILSGRDLLDKSITISEGDYFSYNKIMFEIQSYLNMDNIFGQEEYDNSFKIIGRLARPGTFNNLLFGYDKNGKLFIDGEGQKTFTQQRGLPEIDGLATGDVRQTRERLVDSDPMAEVALGDGPRTVGPTSDIETNSFYHEDDVNK